MRIIFFAILVFVSCASAWPSRFWRFGHGWDWDSDFFFPRLRWPIWSFDIPKIKPWYEGDHVCKEEKLFNYTDDMKEFLCNDFSDYDYSHETESCKGGNERIVCIKKVMSSKKGCTIRKSIYTCCPGYVRNMYEPGCVKNDQSPDGPVPEQASPSQVRENDKFRYNIVPFPSGSSKVEDVPAQ